MKRTVDNHTAATFALHVWALPPQWVCVRGTPTDVCPTKCARSPPGPWLSFQSPSVAFAGSSLIFLECWCRGDIPLEGDKTMCACVSPGSDAMPCRAGGFTAGTQSVPSCTASPLQSTVIKYAKER